MQHSAQASLRRNIQRIATHSVVFRPIAPCPRSFSQSSPTNSCCSRPKVNRPNIQKPSSHDEQTVVSSVSPQPSPFQLRFWKSRSSWKRAGVNTFRCLVGCTLGDFSALWLLQTHFAYLGMGTIMALSMTSGITTSIILETFMLHRGVDHLSWPMAAKTAMGMSLVSMLAMELVENAVDYHLTGGVVALHDPHFWLAAALSVGAGFLAPLPYNYFRLRRYGKACH